MDCTLHSAHWDPGPFSLVFLYVIGYFLTLRPDTSVRDVVPELCVLVGKTLVISW